MLVIGKCYSSVCSAVILYSVRSYCFYLGGDGKLVYDMGITL